MTTPELTCFKAYDVRGRIPDELNPDIAYRIGRARRGAGDVYLRRERLGK